jgi:hypothetical protein
MIEKAVLDFLNTLTPALRRRTLLAFDSDSRFAWHYVPRAHKGVLIKAMNDAQRDAAMAVLQAALSERGYERCQNIMRLETVVAEIEEDPDTYDPGNYALAIFGTPGSSAPWAWRIEGHHLALNFTHVADDIAVTPTFFGAQPATVEKGHLTGLRVLGEEEDNGRAADPQSGRSSTSPSDHSHKSLRRYPDRSWARDQFARADWPLARSDGGGSSQYRPQHYRAVSRRHASRRR